MVTMAKYDSPLQGPDFDADLCVCDHDRGSHFDGEGACGYCQCQEHEFAGCRCGGTLTHMPDCFEGAGL